MLSYIRRSAPLAAVLLFAACDSQTSAPTAPASIAAIPSSVSPSVERTVEENLSDFSGVLTKFFCEDGTETELVALEGKLFTRTVVTINPAGAIVATSHSMPVGLRGVGVESGEEYRVKEQEHYSVSQRVIGYAGTLRDVFEMTGRESKRTFKLVTIAHFTINANGDVVVERERVRSECGR